MNKCHICGNKIKAEGEICKNCKAEADEKIIFQDSGNYDKGFLNSKVCNFIMTNKRFIGFVNMEMIGAGQGLVGEVVGKALINAVSMKNGKIVLEINIQDIVEIDEIDKTFNRIFLVKSKDNKIYKLKLPKRSNLKEAFEEFVKS